MTSLGLLDRTQQSLDNGRKDLSNFDLRVDGTAACYHAPDGLGGEETRNELQRSLGGFSLTAAGIPSENTQVVTLFGRQYYSVQL